MFLKIKSFPDWIRNHISVNVVNKMAIVVILVYYYIGLMSYITTPIPFIYRYFKPSSGVAIGLRAFMTALICLYSILVLIVYKKKFPWKWLVIFAFVLGGTLFAMLISPQTYRYIYVENLYKVVHWVQLSQGTERNIVMFLSAIADFAFAFCALFILPFVINDKKQMLILFVPIVIIGLLECGYSILKEKDTYIYLFTHPDDIYGGYNHDIGATFGNKEDWGAFLTLSFTCAISSSFFINKDRKWKWVVSIGFWVCAFIFGIFAVLSLCKSAMLAIFLALFIMFLWFWYFSFKKKNLFGIIYSLFACLLVCTVVLFFTIPSFHSSGILKKIYDYLVNFIFNRASNALGGRTSLWVNLVQNFRSYNFLFGFGKNGLSVYTKTLTPEGQSTLHNGIAYFLGSYGIFGFLLFIIVFAIILVRIINVSKVNLSYVFLMIAALLSCMTFVLAEAEVLIFSTSNPIFIYNVFLVVFPMGIVIKESNNMEVLRYA